MSVNIIEEEKEESLTNLQMTQNWAEYLEDKNQIPNNPNPLAKQVENNNIKFNRNKWQIFPLGNSRMYRCRMWCIWLGNYI